jgi:cysteine desulfurase
METIYFDYNATTPVDAGVRDAMAPFLAANWGNASSVHRVGRMARAVLDESRERVANVLACKPSEVVFTSGGTESANLAILGTARKLRERGRHIIASAVEHHAVLHCCEYLAKREGFHLSILPVDASGRVSPEDIKRSLRPDTILITVMAANNEIGSLQPVAEIGAICQEKGVLFHTDAVQWFGKEPFRDIHQFNADLVSVCAHKLHGPKGAGALFVRSPFQPEPILLGGSHENERRAGTENLAGIVGLTEVLERFVTQPVFDPQRLLPLTDRLREGITAIEGTEVLAAHVPRLANTVAFLTEGTDSIALLAGLDIEGICASSGSACSSGSIEPSHVVQALNVRPQWANSLVRFSLGRHSTAEEVSYVAETLPQIIRRARLYGSSASG